MCDHKTLGDWTTASSMEWPCLSLFSFSLFLSFTPQQSLSFSLSFFPTLPGIVHATAAKPQGPYVIQEMIVQPWAHNAIITQDPLSGLYLIFHIGNAQVDPSQWELL